MIKISNKLILNISGYSSKHKKKLFSSMFSDSQTTTFYFLFSRLRLQMVKLTVKK